MLFGLGIVLMLLNLFLLAPLTDFYWLLLVTSLVVFLLVLQFFRNPTRTIDVFDNNLVYAPADGKIVVIEEVEEPEYFKEKRLQISIFMTPLNVHVNRNPLSGEVKYLKYHAGKYMVASHQKASTENERTTVVIDNGQTEIMLRQVAGAVARRIINYLQQGQQVKQGSEMGFIKFGSRVDVFLPLNTELFVKINEEVKGNKTVLARLH